MAVLNDGIRFVATAQSALEFARRAVNRGHFDDILRNLSQAAEDSMEAAVVASRYVDHNAVLDGRTGQEHLFRLTRRALAVSEESRDAFRRISPTEVTTQRLDQLDDALKAVLQLVGG